MNKFTEAELVDFFRKTIAEEMRIREEEVETDVEFINFGLDSIHAIFVLQHIEKFIGEELNPLLLWDYPTIESFCQHIVVSNKKN